MRSFLRTLPLTCWLTLLALSLPLLAQADDGPPSYWTGEELLVAINAKMAELKKPPFTMDELTAWLVAQANVRRQYSVTGLSESPVPAFLEDLIKRERFRFSTQLRLSKDESFQVAERAERSDALPVPPHRVLELYILRVPWGAVDKDGNNLKISWDSMVVATALDEKATPKSP